MVTHFSSTRYNRSRSYQTREPCPLCLVRGQWEPAYTRTRRVLGVTSWREKAGFGSLCCPMGLSYLPCTRGGQHTGDANTEISEWSIFILYGGQEGAHPNRTVRLKTNISFEVKRTLLVINYQNSSSQAVFAYSSCPNKESHASKPPSSVCSPGCFKREGDDQSADLETTKTSYLHWGKKEGLNLEIS